MTGEELRAVDGVPVLTYARAGDRALPPVVFLPGGGHLARIAYGYPGGRAEDFLVHWLAHHGRSLLAISYPTDHPATGGPCPHLTVTQWAAIVAQTVRATADRLGWQREVVVLAWSMAGRLATALNLAACMHGVRLRCFVSLAASAPIPGMVRTRTQGEPLTVDGLWDVLSTARVASWRQELAEQSRRARHEIVPWPDYLAHFCGNTPLQLRGEADRFVDGVQVKDTGDAVEDVQTFRFDVYPPVAAIVPRSQNDARHALTDVATWTFATAQRIAAAHGERTLPPDAWAELRALVASLPARLVREVDGGHLFFLGEPAARKTAELALALADEAAAVERELAALLSAAADTSCA